MSKRILRSLLILCIFLFLPSGMAWGALPNQPPIKVGLANGQSSVKVETLAASGSGYKVYYAGNVIATLISDDKLEFTVTSDQPPKIQFKRNDIVIGNYIGPIEVKENAHNTGNRVYRVTSMSRVAYRGNFIVRIYAKPTGDDKLVAINQLPIEEYLYGVVPNEMSSSWPLEALKAQAMTARTYARSHFGSKSALGFDVWTDTRDQEYRGASSESERARDAVNGTKGKVILYDGSYISAYFFSCSGGWTENSEDVWSSKLNYIRAVKDKYEPATLKGLKPWTMTLTMEQLAERINGWYYRGHYIDVGKILKLQILETTANPAINRTEGRVKKLRVTGTKGYEDIYNADNVRIALSSGGDFKSSFFTMSYNGLHYEDLPQGYTSGATVSVINGNGEVSSLNLNGQAVVAASGDSVLGAYNVAGRMQVPASYTFHGKGWGHGLGMSQWGAYGMANTNKPGTSPARKYTGEEIIQHYYTGVTISPVWQ